MPSPHPHVFECSCGTVHNSADRRLPVGWSTCHGNVWCADCTFAGVPERQLRNTRRRLKAA